MSLRRRLVPSPAVAVSMAALIVALCGVAVAAIPGPDGVIHACIAKDDLVKQLGAALAPITQAVSPKGALRVIDSGESCGAGETALNFNQTGPPASGAASSTPTVFSERTRKNQMVGSKMTTVFSATLPAGSYEVRGNLHFAQPKALKVDQRAVCAVIGPSGKVITDSTVSETLKAAGSNDVANLGIDTVIDQMPQGTVTVACEDIVAPGAHQAATSARASQAQAIGSPGVVSGNVIQAPIHVPVNVCGNTVNVIGLLNPSFGSTCVNN